MLLVKEAIHNIIKHSGADNVSFKMNCINGIFSIVISDNGKGIVQGKDNGSGNGMKNMQNRVKKLQGAFSIKNQDGLTLTFEFYLKKMA